VTALRVLATGPLTTVQDLGRPGWAHLGVTPSGAADRSAFRLANRLVANAEAAPALEVTLGGLAVKAEGGPLLVAVTGAHCPITIDGTDQPHRALLILEPGAVLRLGQAPVGLRGYLAVRGGLKVSAQLGSSATDMLSGLGPAPLQRDDVLQIHSGAGSFARGWPVTEVAPGSWDEGLGGVATLTAIPGPRDGVLTGSLGQLTDAIWQVSENSDRVGVRLLGPALTVSGDAAQLPSEPVVRGAVQVPPGGEPVLFMADHPVTGGYPAVAVLTERSADRAAQLRPGDRVRMHLAARPGWAD
jgi:biotin-dependent carboxylase-like uncharacterized protein